MPKAGLNRLVMQLAIGLMGAVPRFELGTPWFFSNLARWAEGELDSVESLATPLMTEEPVFLGDSNFAV